MIELIGGSWLIGELGGFDLPANVKRCERSPRWRVYSEADTFWEFPDSKWGNPYLSMREAVQFAVTIGSISYQDTVECRELTIKHRLHETGVLGVYLRSGLGEGYWVIYDGNLIKLPYNDGKGFITAVRTLNDLKVPSVEMYLDQFTDNP